MSSWSCPSTVPSASPPRGSCCRDIWLQCFAGPWVYLWRRVYPPSGGRQVVFIFLSCLLSPMCIRCEWWRRPDLCKTPLLFTGNVGPHIVGECPSKGGRRCLMSSPCLESQGCHLIPLYYLLSCSSASSYYSFCLIFFSACLSILLNFFQKILPIFFVKR